MRGRKRKEKSCNYLYLKKLKQIKKACKYSAESMMGLKSLNVRVQVEIRTLDFKHSTFTKSHCKTENRASSFALQCFQTRSCVGVHFSFALGQSSGPHLLSSGITAVNFHTWFMIFFFYPSLLQNSVSKQHFT